MDLLKRLFAYFLSFAFLGALLVSLIVPRMLGWYYDPGKIAPISCAPAILEALEKMRTTQLVAAIVGGIVGIVACLLLVRRRRPAEPPQPLSNA